MAGSARCRFELLDEEGLALRSLDDFSTIARDPAFVYAEDGRRLAHVPEWKATANIRYDRPVAGNNVYGQLSWAFTDEVDTVQLESNPADPYSVNIWVIAIDPNLYVHAGDNRAQWVENMEADPRVRMQVEDSVYVLAAARVEGQDEFDRFSDAYEKKYGRRPGNENVSEAYLFRLAPR